MGAMFFGAAGGGRSPKALPDHLGADPSAEAAGGGAEITAGTRETEDDRGGQQRRSAPGGKTVLPEPTDPGLDAVRRAPQGLGTPGIRLPKLESEVESCISSSAVVGKRSFGKCRVIGADYVSIHV